MAIITDSIVDVGNYITFNIGLSKSIGNYTADEIWNFPYCSSSWDAFRHICDQSYQGIAPGSIEASEYEMPFHFTGVNQMYVPATYNFEEGQIEYNQGEKGIYGKIIWLCELGDTSIGHIFGTQRCITNTDGVKIITQMDMTQVYEFLDTFQDPSNNDPMYVNYDNFKIKENHDGITTYEHPRNCSIFPAVMFQYNGELYIHRIFQNSYTSLDWSWWLSYYGDSDHGGHTELQGHTFNAQPVSYDGSKEAYFAINIMRQFSGLTPVSTERFYTASDIEDVGVRYQWMYGYDGGRICPATEAKYLQMASWYGCMFHHGDKYYKPIIEDGYVTGYTDDMTVPSDIDNWIGATNHDVPPSPPGPGPSDDDPSDDQAWGGAYSGAGAFSKFYLCTATDLANLRTWFGGGGSGDQIPDNFDPMGQVLGLLQYPISISGTALAAEEIVFRSGKTIVHTNVNATRSTGGFLHIDCGSVDIPRRMQERGVPFLDFETTLEIYVPFCGTAPLDVQTCVGKTLTCDLYVATATGDVSAVIAAGGHPVAYMSGNMAESLPISSGGYGMYLAACKNAWSNGVTQVMNQLTGGTTDTLKNVNQAALNETLSYGQTGGWGHSELLAESYNNPRVGRAMAAAAGPGGAAAIGLIKTGLNVLNAATTGYEHYQHVKNASYTSVSGSFTSCAAWNYPFTPYVKITRPHKQIPTGGKGDYKHTSAIPLVETRNLSGAPGLTTCVNPDVSGIANATAQEKDIIYRALVNGVIV